MKRHAWLLLPLVTLATSSPPLTSSSPGQAPPQVVHAQVLLATDAAHAGSSVRAAVEADISPGYHINDHKPTLDYLIPTEVKIQADKQISLEKLSYPRGEPKKFAFAGQPLSVYEGRIFVGAVLRVPPGVAPGSYPVIGRFSYQACNEQACLPPASVPLSFTIKVVARNVPLKRSNSDVFNKLPLN